MHLQNGAIRQHFENEHQCELSHQVLENNTRIIYKERDPQRLQTLESLVIRFTSPVINQQDTGFSRILHLF